jgi:putative oxidoreductase
MNAMNPFRSTAGVMPQVKDSTIEIAPAIKRAAYALLWLALIAQIAWIVFEHFQRHVPLLSMAYPVAYVTLFFVLASTGGRIRWIATVLRLIIALSFLLPVADRMGLLGGPGTPGVTWGDFAHFITYTGQVNAFMSPATIPTLAVLATMIEAALCLTMLLGIYTRASAIGSAALLFTYATAMTISGLSQFEYSVYLMCAGSLALAAVDASLFSVDALVRWRKTPVGEESFVPAVAKSDRI